LNSKKAGASSVQKKPVSLVNGKKEKGVISPWNEKGGGRGDLASFRRGGKITIGGKKEEEVFIKQRNGPPSLFILWIKRERAET